MISTSSSIDKANITKLKVFEESVSNNLSANMVSAWDADHVTKGATWVLNDQWGNNNGTFYDDVSTACTTALCPQIVSDNQMGNVISFDGTSDYIKIGQDTFKFQEFTISAWVYVDTIQNYIILWSNDYTSHVTPWYAQHLRINGSATIDFAYNIAGAPFSVSTTGIFTSKKWNNIVATFRSGEQKIYFNGESKGVHTDVGAIAYYNQPVWIGNANFGRTKACKMNDFRLYNATLSSSQIKQNYIAGLDFLLSNQNISKEEYDERINALAYGN